MPTTTDDNTKFKKQHFDYGTVYIHFRTVAIVFSGWDSGEKS